MFAEMTIKCYVTDCLIFFGVNKDSLKNKN